MKINSKHYKVISKTEAGENTKTKIGVIAHYVLSLGNRLFTADEFKDGRFRLIKISNSLISIL